MIKHFVVENFKSIEYLNIDCARINIFIGNPGSGKSNILEALGLLFHVYYSLKFGKKGSKPLRGFVRYKTLIDIFRDRMLKNKPRIMTDDVELLLDVRDGSVVGSTSIRANGVSKELFVYTQIGELLRKQSIDFDVFRKYNFLGLRG